MLDYSHELSLMFDSKKNYDDELPEIITYIKKYPNNWIFTLYIDGYEQTACASFYNSVDSIRIFSASFTHTVKEIICDKNSIKLYRSNNILLAQLSLEPMVSIKLSIQGNV